MSQHSSWKQDTRPALRHNHQVGSRILDWLYVTALIIIQDWLIIIQDWLYVTTVKLEAQYLSHLIILLYVTTLKLEARYSSCFTSQPSGWKQDTRLALRHSYPVGSSVLVSSYHLALHLTTRSEVRNVSSCFTSDNSVRSKELISSCFTSDN
jgi:hypothetical protein